MNKILTFSVITGIKFDLFRSCKVSIINSDYFVILMSDVKIAKKVEENTENAIIIELKTSLSEDYGCFRYCESQHGTSTILKFIAFERAVTARASGPD